MNTDSKSTKSKTATGPANSMRELRQTVEEIKGSDPVVTAFKLWAQLPRRGRTDTPIATTDDLWVVLKCYAGGGENELHAHPHEDHVFVVMQGKAEFIGPDDKIAEVGRFGGVMIPHGAYYKFCAVGDEPLVMLRVGTTTTRGRDKHHRVHPDGRYFDPFSRENKYEEVEYYEGRFFG